MTKKRLSGKQGYANLKQTLYLLQYNGWAYCAYNILYEAQQYWSAMDTCRRDREQANKKYTYGKQWTDYVCVDGGAWARKDILRNKATYLLKQPHQAYGECCLAYRSQASWANLYSQRPWWMKYGETGVNGLMYMQLNRMTEINARMEEFISGFVVQRNGMAGENKPDCWTDYVQPNNFIDNNMRLEVGS